MKKILSLFVLLPLMVFAQTQTENYIKNTTYKTPTTTRISTPTISQASQNITYFDGLGRPIQQIAHQQSGTGKDIVTPIEYDGFGRQPKDYLPYVPNATASLDYKTSALTDVLNFAPYTGQNPFSEKLLEASPLNRVFKQAAPGTDWALNSGHEIKLDYQTNTTSDAVKLFSVTTNWDSTKGLYDIPTSLTPADYLDFQLYKNITYDENSAATPTESNGATVEFKNKEGQVVLKRTYESGVKHDTYYVYDQYGNLTFVIPPLANATTIISNTILNDLCYQYKYDSRNRLVEKKLPGKQWEFIVYDKLDRVVATGPALSPFSDLTTAGWLITKYDAFSRVVYTGWENSIAESSTRTTKQSAQNGLTTSLNEAKTAPGAIDGIATFYTNSVAPTAFKLLTVNYYDDYNFNNAPTFPAYSYDGVPAYYNNTTMKPKGMPTGSWVRVLTLSSSLAAETSYTIYNDKARPVTNYTANYLGGFTKTEMKYDFIGNPTTNYTNHKRSSADVQILVNEGFTYTPQGRLLTHTHQINNGVVQLLATNTYDELGQLISKNVGNTSAAPLQKIDYAYNIRGWMTEINKVAALQQGSDPKDLFGFKINYNTIDGDASVTKKLYNGNIAETSWSTSTVVRTYGYKYDNLNRLTFATYQKSGITTNAYNENLTYDKNGNIKHLNRFGLLDPQTPSPQIDDLTYEYKSSTSNQLTKVTDSPSGNDNEGFIDGNKSGDDYNYDANGNLITDLNKNITQIVYNHLNLPTKITFGATGNIVYIYNAIGQKLEKIVTQGTVTNTNYLGGFQYQSVNGATMALQFFPTAEGYVKNTAGVYSYVFNYTDHLGNVRLSYGLNANVLTIIEENNYYPFGLKHKGYNEYTPTSNKYKYNGKELQDELGLNVYDMDARNYDPALGRFTSFDPITHYHQSPYSAFNGNPVYWADPSGMEGEHYNWKTEQYENKSGQKITFEEAMAGNGMNTDGSEKSNDSNNTASDIGNSSTNDIHPKDAFGYQSKYPRTMAVLKQLRRYVKSNPTILKKLSEWSGYSTMEVLDKLNYSNGDIQMEIRELLSLNAYNPEGLTDSSSHFFLNIENAERLEILQKNDELQAYSFFVAVTILHELVHVGRRANNLNIYDTDEMGWGWERDTFDGNIINGSFHKDYFPTTKALVKKFNWSFKDSENKIPQLPKLF